MDIGIPGVIYKIDSTRRSKPVVGNGVSECVSSTRVVLPIEVLPLPEDPLAICAFRHIAGYFFHPGLQILIIFK